MGIVVELAANILTDPEVVWGLLERPATWKVWWRDCIEAQTGDRRAALREGSELELVLRPKQLKFTFRPVVDLLTENRTLSLTHRSATVQTTVAWYLAEKRDTTQVAVQAVFNGFLPFVMSLAQQRDTVRFSLHGNLRGLKRAAERGGAEALAR